METTDLRERYSDIVLDRIRSARYPSGPLLDRAEAGLGSLDDAVEYVEVLLEKVDTTYPSPELLDRIRRMIDVLEYAEARAGRGRDDGGED